MPTWKTGDAGEAERQLDLAHEVDPDPERARRREAMFARDLDELRFLATSDLGGQPASTIALLASALLRLRNATCRSRSSARGSSSPPTTSSSPTCSPVISLPI